jgi:hypothetical protein
MSGKPPSIGDIISQFAMPPTPPSSPAQEWLHDFTSWLENSYEKTVHATRAPGLHASDLPSVCARRELIYETFGKPAKKTRAGNALIYGFGHAMHFWWQNRFLGPKQELWGDWLCTACPCILCGNSDLSSKPEPNCKICHGAGRKITRGFMPMECECGLPWQDTIRYMEVMVENKELGYVGHTDGIIRRNSQEFVFEFKTDGEKYYAEREAPELKHIIQAHAYMGPLQINKALIVYQNKGKQCEFTRNGSEWTAGAVNIKPYFISFDPVIWGPIEQRVKDHHEARAYIQQILDDGRKFNRDDIAKFRRVCDSPKCQLARDCPVASQCFSLS